MGTLPKVAAIDNRLRGAVQRICSSAVLREWPGPWTFAVCEDGDRSYDIAAMDASSSELGQAWLSVLALPLHGNAFLKCQLRLGE